METLFRFALASTMFVALAASGCNCGGNNGEGNNGDGTNNGDNMQPGDTTPPTTSADPGGGTYGEPVRVTLSCGDGDGSGCEATYYTLDDSPPTTESAIYDEPILIGTDTTLTFFSTDLAGNEESPRTETYTFSDDTPPEVVETEPADGAADVDPFASVTVRFSEPIEPSTLTDETFRVGVLPGSVEYDVDADAATFTPRFPMPANTALDARITTGVTDLAGNPIAEEFVWSFTTGEPDEESLTSLQTGALQARPQVVFDDDQAGLAVWVSDARPGRQVLYSYRDSPDAEWSADETLSVDLEDYPAVAAAGSGFAAAWATPAPEGGENVQVRVFEDGAWGEVTTLASSPVDGAYAVRLVSNGTGYAVSWQEGSGGTAHVYTSVLEGGVWSDPEVQDDNLPGENLGGSTSASNGDGYAVAWRQYDATLDTWDVYVSVYESGTWYRASVDDPAYPGFAYDPQLASNGSGYGVAFRHNTGGQTAASAVIYSGGSWGPATLISPAIPGFGAERPAIAGDRSGGYVAAWPQSAGAGDRRLYASSHSASGWAPATLLQDPGTSDYFGNVNVAALSGQFAVTWTQGPTNATRAYAATYEAGGSGGWSGVTNLSSGSESVSVVRLAPAEGEDEFLAVWLQGNDGALWASRHTDPGGWAGAVSVGESSDRFTLDHDGEDFFVARTRTLERSSEVELLAEAEGVWGEPTTLVQQTHVSSTGVHGFAVGPEGDVVAVWSERQGPTSVLFASTNEGRAWSTPVELATAQTFWNLQAIGGRDGFGVAIQTLEGADQGVYGAVFENESWTVEELDPNTGTPVSNMSIASSDVGYVLAWEHDDTRRDAWAATFDGEWSTPRVVSDDTASGPASAVAVAGLSGELLVAYQQEDNLFTASWNGTDWNRELITTDASSRAAGQVTKAAANDDSVVLVWTEYTGGLGGRVHGAVREGDTWSLSELLTDAGTINAAFSEATAGDDGFGVTVVQDDRLFATIYTDGAWTTAEVLDDGATPPMVPTIVPIAAGYGVAWRQESATPADDDVWFRSFDGDGWDAAAKLDDGTGEVGRVDLVAAGDRIVAVWGEEPVDSPVGVFTTSFRESWTLPRRLDDGVAPGAAASAVFHRGSGVVGAAWRDRVTSVDPAAVVLVYLPSL